MIGWQHAVREFERLLRAHGAVPGAVTEVEPAWRAFAAFLRTGISGIDAVDGDGFIVQWGRRSWTGDRLGLDFTRQLGVLDGPELYQVRLELVFADEPGLTALEAGLDSHDTGFRFERGEQAVAAARAQAWRQALVRALWTTTPVESRLSGEFVG